MQVQTLAFASDLPANANANEDARAKKAANRTRAFLRGKVQNIHANLCKRVHGLPLEDECRVITPGAPYTLTLHAAARSELRLSPPLLAAAPVGGCSNSLSPWACSRNPSALARPGAAAPAHRCGYGSWCMMCAWPTWCAWCGRICATSVHVHAHVHAMRCYVHVPCHARCRGVSDCAGSLASTTSYLQIALTQPPLCDASCHARAGADAALHVSDAGVVVERNEGFVHDGVVAVPPTYVSRPRPRVSK